MSQITTVKALRALYGMPGEIVQNKCLSRLEKHCRNFITQSPYLVIASYGADGLPDASPRGDHPGFVYVESDNSILIPDRPGNKLVDTLSNIVANPQVGLVFFIPGINDLLRINGIASIHDDQNLLDLVKSHNKQPISVIRVEVRQAFLHCAKSLIRSSLWNPEKHIDRKQFPSLGQMIKDQLSLPGDPESRFAMEARYTSSPDKLS